MSNLLKQCYVINRENEKRVINSDEIYTSNNIPVNSPMPDNDLEEVAPGSEEILDGFLAGLAAEEVVLEPKITPEELLEQAREEAEEIVAKAKAEALQVEEEARKEAEMLFEQKKLEGYHAGTSQMQEELEAEKARIQEELGELKSRLQSEHDSRMETMESDIIDAIIAVFNRVFDIQFDDKKQILLHLVNHTLTNEGSGKEFHIRVSSSNYKFMEEHIGELKETIGNDVSIEIVNDKSLEPEACIIETESGVFNCGIDTELTSLKKDIKSLCNS